MIWVGASIVLVTFYAIIKRYETRLALFLSGLLMAILSGTPFEAFNAFSVAMINGGLVPVICTVMGFAYTMKVTKCDQHLVQLLTGILTKFRVALIPGTVLVTFATNIALPSAAGCAAAVGAILIPTLISAGIHPAIAASAVLAGTWGSVFSPGSAHNPFIAKLANVDVMTVIAGHTKASLIGAVVTAVVLTVVAVICKENGNQDKTAEPVSNDEEFQVNYLKAAIPLIPLLLLVLGSKQINIIPEITVPQAMITGVMLAFMATCYNPQELSKQFFAGIGEAYGSVIGIIIAAAVFTKGMELIGLTGALIEFMKQSTGIAKMAATFGPFIIAVLSGSGDAATLAFNGAITPYAEQFGFGITQIGSLAYITGALGRSMSPVAAAAIVCAQLAGISTIELAKRNAPAMLLTAIVTMFVLL